MFHLLPKDIRKDIVSLVDIVKIQELDLMREK